MAVFHLIKTRPFDRARFAAVPKIDNPQGHLIPSSAEVAGDLAKPKNDREFMFAIRFV